MFQPFRKVGVVFWAACVAAFSLFACGKIQNESDGGIADGGGTSGGSSDSSSALFYLERDGCTNRSPKAVASPNGAFTVVWLTQQCTDSVQNGLFGARYENGAWSTPQKLTSQPSLFSVAATGESDVSVMITLPSSVQISELRHTKPNGFGYFTPYLNTLFPPQSIYSGFNAAGQGVFVAHSANASNTADQTIELFTYAPASGWKQTATTVERLTPTTGQSQWLSLLALHVLPSGNSNVFYQINKTVFSAQPSSPSLVTSSIEVRKYSPGGVLLAQGKIAETSESVPSGSYGKLNLGGFISRVNRRGDAVACYSLTDESVPATRTLTFLCRKSQGESDWAAAEVIATIVAPSSNLVATALSEVGDAAFAFTASGKLRPFVSSVSALGWTEKPIDADDLLYPVMNYPLGAFHKADNVLRLVWRTTSPDVTFYKSELRDGAWTPRVSLGKFAATPTNSEAGLTDGLVLQGGSQGLLLYPYNNSVRLIFAGLWL
ncbi:MAG: hypothetical protein HYY84_11880 [Deltaproteobacteria bacterium]|nr:hypothetical protein [Deltaproteobacteria bacterium]